MNRSYPLFLSFFCLLFLPFQDAQAATKTLRADSHAEIVPILELSVSQQGARELKFGDLMPSSLGPTDAPVQTILVEVHCNSGVPYQVTQALSGELENAQGETIPLDNLKFKTTSLKSTGKGINDFTSVTSGTQTIFISDKEGTSDSVTALYRLTIPSSQAPGDYSALLTYTVSSI